MSQESLNTPRKTLHFTEAELYTQHTIAHAQALLEKAREMKCKSTAKQAQLDRLAARTQKALDAVRHIRAINDSSVMKGQVPDVGDYIEKDHFKNLFEAAQTLQKWIESDS